MNMREIVCSNVFKKPFSSNALRRGVIYAVDKTPLKNAKKSDKNSKKSTENF